MISIKRFIWMFRYIKKSKRYYESEGFCLIPIAKFPYFRSAWRAAKLNDKKPAWYYPPLFELKPNIPQN